MRRLLLLGAALASTAALGDIISPIEAACRGKKAGEACRAEFGQGVCGPAKCTRNDYSEGPPPKRKEVECLTCEARAPDAGAPASVKQATPRKR
ncbi:MAG: hypothetical protein INH41_10465 [Myxococcaceae bacterium]|jgi:hypothetical protein|nr:hypothetical protein [Myxococcaceae bacterium]MCA3012807.1 hypothetical protein [Myxococcaceae bacterium]